MAIVEQDSDAPAEQSPHWLAIGWLAAAAAASLVVPFVIGASVPVFTLVWLMIAGIVLRGAGTPSAVGFVQVPPGEFARVTVAATTAMTLLFAAAETLSHPYRGLLDLIREESTPDSTFAWILEWGRGWGLVGFAVYGGLVTIFAEEIVFRGVLMNRLRPRGQLAAVAGTTVAFGALQALPAALLPAGAAVGFVLLDVVLAVGVVGGVAAYRTGSIVPGLIAITIANVVVLAAVA